MTAKSIVLQCTGIGTCTYLVLEVHCIGKAEIGAALITNYRQGDFNNAVSAVNITAKGILPALYYHKDGADYF